MLEMHACQQVGGLQRETWASRCVHECVNFVAFYVLMNKKLFNKMLNGVMKK